MERFLERHQSGIAGVLAGFDRLLFRGSLRSICYVKGLEIFLSAQGVLIKQFKEYVLKLSSRINEHAKQFAKQHHRPYIFVRSPQLSKEDWARRIQQEDDIREGLICIFGCVEPCRSYQVRHNPKTCHIELESAERKCLHLYYYFAHRDFGFMHVRVQSWLPMTVQICINGREYLARQMDREGIGYEQRDNCFVQIDDLKRAQEILDRLTTRRWEGFLRKLADLVNPWIHPSEGLDIHGYYWSVRQGEFATDVMFHDKPSLQAIYPSLVKHAMHDFSSKDVLRFLGRRTNSRFNGEVKTHFQEREEGVRIKHWAEENSIKMYDKQGSVLRIETTINNPRRFKVRRLTHSKGKRRMGWLPLRRGIADMIRRVEISRAANERYLAALAVVDTPIPTSEIFDPVQRRITKRNRSHRPLRPLTKEENQLFEILLHGENFIQGFRNRNVRQAIYPTQEKDPAKRRRAAARVTRWFQLLRAHGLIRKVSRTTYYRVTNKGHQVMSAAINLRRSNPLAIAS